MHPGAVYEVIIVQDKLYIMNETLQKVKAPTFAAYELTNEVMRSEYSYELVLQNGRTEIITRYLITGNNLMWKSILFLSKSYMESASHTQLELLKREIEKNNPESEK